MPRTYNGALALDIDDTTLALISDPAQIKDGDLFIWLLKWAQENNYYIYINTSRGISLDNDPGSNGKVSTFQLRKFLKEKYGINISDAQVYLGGVNLADLKVTMRSELSYQLPEEKDDIGENPATRNVANFHHKKLQQQIVEANPGTPTKIIVNRKIAEEITDKITVLDDSEGEIRFAIDAGFDAVHFDLKNPDIDMRTNNVNVDLRRPHLDLLAEKLGLFNYMEKCYGNPKVFGYSEKLDSICREFMAARARRAKGLCPSPIFPISTQSAENTNEQNQTQDDFLVYSPSLIEHIKKTTEKGSFIKDVFIPDLLQLNAHSPFYIKDHENQTYVLDKKKVRKALENKGNTGLGSNITNLIVQKNLDIIFADKDHDLTPHEIDQKIHAYIILIGLHEAGSDSIRKNPHKAALIRAIKAADESLPDDVRAEEYKILADYYYDHKDYKNAATLYIDAYKTATKYSPLINSNTFKNNLINTWNIAIEKFPFLRTKALQWLKEIENNLTAQDPLTLWRCQLLANAQHENSSQEMILVALQVASGKTNIKGNDVEKINQYCKHLADLHKNADPELAELWYHAALFPNDYNNLTRLAHKYTTRDNATPDDKALARMIYLYVYTQIKHIKENESLSVSRDTVLNALANLAYEPIAKIDTEFNLRMQDTHIDDTYQTANHRIYEILIPNILAVNLKNPSPYYTYDPINNPVNVNYEALRESLLEFLPIVELPQIISNHLHSLLLENLIPAHKLAIYNELISYFQYGSDKTNPVIVKNKAFELIFRALKAADQSLLLNERLRELRIMSDIYSENNEHTQALACTEIAKKMLPPDQALQDHWQYLKDINNVTTIAPQILSILTNAPDNHFYTIDGNSRTRENNNLRISLRNILYRDQNNPIVSREVDKIFHDNSNEQTRLDAYNKLIEYFRTDTPQPQQPRGVEAVELTKNETIVLVLRALKASDAELPLEVRMQELKYIADYYFEHGDFIHAANYYEYIYNHASPISRLKQAEFLLSLPLHKAKSDPASGHLIFKLADKFDHDLSFNLSNCLTRELTEHIEVESTETLIYFLDMLFSENSSKKKTCQKFIDYYSRAIMQLMYDDSANDSSSIITQWRSLQQHHENKHIFSNGLLKLAFTYASASFKNSKLIAKEILERILSNENNLPYSDDLNHATYLAKAKLLLAYLYLQGDDGFEINLERALALLHEVQSSKTDYSTIALNLLATLYKNPSDKVSYPHANDLAIPHREETLYHPLPTFDEDHLFQNYLDNLDFEYTRAKNHGDDVSHRVAINKARAQARNFLADKNQDLGIQLTYFLRFSGNIIRDTETISFIPVDNSIELTKKSLSTLLDSTQLSADDRVVRSCADVMQSLAYINQASQKLHEERDDLTDIAKAYHLLSENPQNSNALRFIEKYHTQHDEDKQTTEIIVNPALEEHQPNIYAFILKQLKASIRKLLEEAEEQYQSIHDIDEKAQARITRNETIESELDSYDISLFQLIQSYYLSINSEVFISHEEKRDKNPWHPENADVIARYKKEIDNFREKFEKELKSLAVKHTQDVYETYRNKIYQVTNPTAEYQSESTDLNLFEHKESRADVTRIISIFNLDSQFTSRKKFYEALIQSTDDDNICKLFQNEIIQAVTQNDFSFSKRFRNDANVRALTQKITAYKNSQKQDLSVGEIQNALDLIFTEICELCLQPSIVEAYLTSKQNKQEPLSLNALKAYALLHQDRISLHLWTSERVDDLHILKTPTTYGRGHTHINILVKSDGSYLLLTDDKIHSKEYKNINNINFANDGDIPPDIHEKMIHEREQLYYIYQHRFKVLIHKQTLEKIRALENHIAKINAQRTITRDDIKELAILIDRQITELKNLQIPNIPRSSYGALAADEENPPIDISTAISDLILQLKSKLSDLKILWDQQPHAHEDNEELWRYINDNSDSDDDFDNTVTPPTEIVSDNEDAGTGLASLLGNYDSQRISLGSSRNSSTYSLAGSEIGDESTGLLPSASTPKTVTKTQANQQKERLEFYQQALKALANPKKSKEKLPKETRKKLKALRKELEKFDLDKDLQEKWRQYFEFGEGFEVTHGGKKYQIGALTIATGMNSAGLVAYLTKLSIPTPLIRLITQIASIITCAIGASVAIPTSIIISGIFTYLITQLVKYPSKLPELEKIIQLPESVIDSALDQFDNIFAPVVRLVEANYFNNTDINAGNVETLDASMNTNNSVIENHSNLHILTLCLVLYLYVMVINYFLFRGVRTLSLLPDNIAESLSDLINYLSPVGGPALVLPSGNQLTDLFGNTPKREGPTYKRHDQEQFENVLQEIKELEKEDDAKLLRDDHDDDRKIDPSIFADASRKKVSGDDYPVEVAEIPSDHEDDLEMGSPSSSDSDEDQDANVQVFMTDSTIAATSSSAFVPAESADSMNLNNQNSDLLAAAARIAQLLKNLFDSLQKPKPSSSMSASTLEIHTIGHGGEPAQSDEFMMSSVPAPAMALSQGIIEALAQDRINLPDKLKDAVDKGTLYKTAMAREIEKEYKDHPESEDLLKNQELAIARDLRKLYPKEFLYSGFTNAGAGSSLFAGVPSSSLRESSHDKSLADAAKNIALAIKKLLKGISDTDRAKINSLDDKALEVALRESQDTLSTIELAQRLNIEGINADLLAKGLQLSLKDQPSSSLQSSAIAIARAILATFKADKQNLHPMLAELTNNSFFANLIADAIMSIPNAASLILKLGDHTKEVAKALKKLFVAEKRLSREPVVASVDATEKDTSEIEQVFKVLKQRGFFGLDRSLANGENIREAVQEAKQGYVRKENVPKI